MKRDEVRQVARAVFDRLVEDVDAGKSETLTAYLKAMGKFHRYSVGNAILIQLQKSDAMGICQDTIRGSFPGTTRFASCPILRGK